VTEFWDDFSIKTHLDNLESRIHELGGGAKAPEPDEWMALTLAICILFRQYYSETYYGDE